MEPGLLLRCACWRLCWEARLLLGLSRRWTLPERRPLGLIRTASAVYSNSSVAGAAGLSECPCTLAASATACSEGLAGTPPCRSFTAQSRDGRDAALPSALWLGTPPPPVVPPLLRRSMATEATTCVPMPIYTAQLCWLAENQVATATDVGHPTPATQMGPNFGLQLCAAWLCRERRSTQLKRLAFQTPGDLARESACTLQPWRPSSLPSARRSHASARATSVVS